MPLPPGLKPKSFHGSIQAPLKKLEKRRLMVVGGVAGAAGLYVLVLLARMFGVIGDAHYFFSWGLLLPVGAAAFAWFKQQDIVSGSAYRELILGRLASKVSPATSFDAWGAIPEDVLKASGLSPVPDAEYRCSEVFKQGPATVGTVRLLRSHGQKAEVLSEGHFVVVEGLAAREGTVVWAPDKKGLKGGTGDLKKVNLEDKWFAAHHPVRSNSLAAAARLKSEDLRKGLIDLSEAHKNQVGVAFVENRAFAWLPLRRKPSLHQLKATYLDPERLKEPYADFEAMLGFLEGMLKAVSSELETPPAPAKKGSAPLAE